MPVEPHDAAAGRPGAFSWASVEPDLVPPEPSTEEGRSGDGSAQHGEPTTPFLRTGPDARTASDGGARSAAAGSGDRPAREPGPAPARTAWRGRRPQLSRARRKLLVPVEEMTGTPQLDVVVTTLDALFGIAERFETVVLDLEADGHHTYAVWDDGVRYRVER